MLSLNFTPKLPFEHKSHSPQAPCYHSCYYYYYTETILRLENKKNVIASVDIVYCLLFTIC